MAKHVRQHCQPAGYAMLARIAKGTVCKILQAHELKPHKINYYLERRDPEFERKMAEVLLVYRHNLSQATPEGQVSQAFVRFADNSELAVQRVAEYWRIERDQYHVAQLESHLNQRVLFRAN